MSTPDPYHPRRRRKARLITAVGFFLLALLGVPWLIGTIAVLVPERPTLRTLAALPYPDPAPNQTDLLTFTDLRGRARIQTEWIPIFANWTDDGTYTGFILMRLTTFTDPGGRDEPTRDISITFAAAGDIRLPADNPLRHPLILTTGDSTARVWPDPYYVGSASMENAPAFRDFMWYDAPTTIIVQAANTVDDFTITIAGFESPVPPEAFAILRAFAATLKPGYQPPSPN